MTIWDSMLNHPHMTAYVDCLCLAITQQLRAEILKTDFTGIMKIFQKLDTLNIEKMLFQANRLYTTTYEENK